MARNFNSVANNEIVVSAGAGAPEIDVDLANAMTVALWFKRNGVQESFASLLCKTVQNGLGSSPAIQYYLTADSASDSAYKIFFGRSDGTQLSAGPGAMSATDGKWNFVAATFFPGETIKFYYAEEFAALTQVAGTATSVGNVLFTDITDPLTIGSFFQTTTSIRNFNGDICHVGLWNARLTQNELNAFRWGKMPQPAALKLWMPLSGDFSPEPDWSPNGNNGVLTGTTKSNHAPIIPYSTKLWQPTHSFEAPTSISGGIVHRKTTDIIDWFNPVNRNHPLNNGLVGWWLNTPNARGGDTFRDLSGTNHGTLNFMDPATDWVTSNRRSGWGALDFDGINDAIRVSDNSTLRNLSTHTISTWVKLKSSGGFKLLIEKWPVSPDNADYNIFLVGTELRSFKTTQYLSGLNVTVGQWDHAVMTYDGTVLTMYLNGVAASLTSTQVYTSHTADFMMGDRTDGSMPADVQLDDVRIYGRCLSSVEVYQLYNLSRTGYDSLLNRQELLIPNIITILGVSSSSSSSRSSSSSSQSSSSSSQSSSSQSSSSQSSSSQSSSSQSSSSQSSSSQSSSSQSSSSQSSSSSSQSSSSQSSSSSSQSSSSSSQSSSSSSQSSSSQSSSSSSRSSSSSSERSSSSSRSSSSRSSSSSSSKSSSSSNDPAGAAAGAGVMGSQLGGPRLIRFD